MKPAGKSRPCFSAQPSRSDAKLFQMLAFRTYGEKEKTFLEKNKVDEIIKHAVLEVLNHKPSNPYKFLANHFEWEFSKSNHTRKAQQLIVSADYSSPSFEDAIHQAFIILRQSKVHDNVKGINGDIYMDLMQAICSDILFDTDGVQQLLENVFVPSSAVVSFRAFRAGIHCCFVFRDFLHCLRRMRAFLERGAEQGASVNPTMPATLAETLLREMNNAPHDCTCADATGAVTSQQSCHHLQQISRGQTTSSVKMKCRTNDGAVLVGEFVAHAQDVFWNEMMANCFYS